MPIWDDPRALARLRKWLYLVLALGLLFLTAHYVADSRLFPVRRIVLKGQLEKISRDQLQYVVRNKISGNVLMLDLNQVQDEFERLTWVKKAEIKRLWPDQLEVDISERKALARWEEGGLLDVDGEWFDATTDEKLPLFVAPKGSEKQIAQMYSHLLPLLRGMDEELYALQLSDRNAWQLVFRSGVVIKLGRKDTLERFKRIDKIWKKYLKHQENNIEYIDLRYPDGFALRLKNKSSEISEPD